MSSVGVETECKVKRKKRKTENMCVSMVMPIEFHEEFREKDRVSETHGGPYNGERRARTRAGRHDNSHLRDPRCQETHEGSLEPYTSELLPPCLAWLNRIGWCVVAWIPLIPLIHLLHLKLWRKDCCYLPVVIPSLNLRHRKSFTLHPKPLLCVPIEFWITFHGSSHLCWLIFPLYLIALDCDIFYF